jgi:hypothetical protein
MIGQEIQRRRRITLAIGAGLIAVVVGVWLSQSSKTGSMAPPPDTSPITIGYTVVYTIGGESLDDGQGLFPGADVTYQTPSGITQQQGVDIPWTDSETMDAGGVPIVSAQNTAAGTVTCEITVNGVVVASNLASGAFAIASCNGAMLGYG